MATKRRKRKGRQITKSIKCSHDGVNFKSKLEMYAYKALKDAKIPFTYEENTYTLVPAFTSSVVSVEYKYRKYRDSNMSMKAITYTPDFVCPKGTWIIETKGRPNELFPMRWKLFKKWLTDTKFATMLFLPTSKAQIDETIARIQAEKK